MNYKCNGLNCVAIRVCDSRDSASIAIANRSGFIYEGLGRRVERQGDREHDVMIFARLRTN